MKFYASIRLDVRRIGSVKKGEEIVGNEVKVKVTKNKVAPPFKEAVFEIMYGKGIFHDGANTFDEATCMEKGIKFNSGEEMMEYFVRKFL